MPALRVSRDLFGLPSPHAAFAFHGRLPAGAAFGRTTTRRHDDNDVRQLGPRQETAGNSSMPSKQSNINGSPRWRRRRPWGPELQSEDGKITSSLYDGILLVIVRPHSCTARSAAASGHSPRSDSQGFRRVVVSSWRGLSAGVGEAEAPARRRRRGHGCSVTANSAAQTGPPAPREPGACTPSPASGMSRPVWSTPSTSTHCTPRFTPSGFSTTIRYSALADLESDLVARPGARECTDRCAARRRCSVRPRMRLDADAIHPARRSRVPGPAAAAGVWRPASRRRRRRRTARRGSARRSPASRAWLIGLSIENSSVARSPSPSSANASTVHSAACVYCPPFSRTPGT